MKFTFKINGIVSSIRFELKKLRFRLAVWLAGENTILNNAKINVNNVCIISNSQFIRLGSNVYINVNVDDGGIGIKVNGSIL